MADHLTHVDESGAAQMVDVSDKAVTTREATAEGRLLMQPATILQDEPFAGLDIPTQTRLHRRLAALPQRLITISHDPAAVATCDRVLWLEQGQIRADGPPGPTLQAFTAEMAQLGERDADTDLAP